MKDWKLLAKALDLDIPEPAVETAATALEAVEAAFRPLVREIPLETEPAYSMRLSPENDG